jgi:hypothetical protein
MDRNRLVTYACKYRAAREIATWAWTIAQDLTHSTSLRRTQ